MAEGEEGEGAEGGEVYDIPKTPEPKEWVCLGSDLEILEAQVHTSRPLVSMEMQTVMYRLSMAISYKYFCI